MPENTELAGKDVEELSEKEAQILGESRSELSLDDYNPSELEPHERVVEWDGESFANQDAFAEKFQKPGKFKAAGVEESEKLTKKSTVDDAPNADNSSAQNVIQDGPAQPRAARKSPVAKAVDAHDADK
jgi:hypothetical protein